MTVYEAQTLLAGGAFLKRVTYALVRVAATVSAEPAEEVVSRRSRRAKAILENPASFTGMYAQGVLAALNLEDYKITEAGDCSVKDEEIQEQIKQIWDWYT